MIPRCARCSSAACGRAVMSWTRSPTAKRPWGTCASTTTRSRSWTGGCLPCPGWTSCGRIRRRGSPVPILMLTARDSAGDRVTGLDEGADDYLVKPFDFGKSAGLDQGAAAPVSGHAKPAPGHRRPRVRPGHQGGAHRVGAAQAHRHRAVHPGDPDAPLPGRRAAPVHRPARMGRGGRRARLQHHRRAHGPAPGQAGPGPGAGRDGTRHRVPAGGQREQAGRSPMPAGRGARTRSGWPPSPP